MKTLLDRKVSSIPLPFLIVCEGFGDAQFICHLLRHLGTENCNVGCPSVEGGHGMGKSGIKKYLRAVAAIIAAGKASLEGLLVIGDADEDEVKAFNELAEAISEAGFTRPLTPFSTAGKSLKIAIYVIPGVNRKGTLEHLLWDAATSRRAQLDECVNALVLCTGNNMDVASENQKAKMRMSVLVGASCHNNPWASPGLMFSDPGNPVPIDSEAFEHVGEFIRSFVS
jgi:hypothetical protein